MEEKKLQKRSITTINNSKSSSDSDTTESANVKDLKSEKKKFSLNKSLSYISNNKNVSNLPLIEKSSLDFNFLENKSNNNLDINNNNNFGEHDVSDFSVKIKPLDKINRSDIYNNNSNKNFNISDNKEKKQVNFFLQEAGDNKNNFKKKSTIYFNSLNNLMKSSNNINENENNQAFWRNININKYNLRENENTNNNNNNENNLNTIGSNIITLQTNNQNHPSYLYPSNKLLNKEFYFSSIPKPNLISQRLQNIDNTNIILQNQNLLNNNDNNNNNEQDQDFKLNFEFYNSNYGNLNKEFKIKILEEKITARPSRAALRSSRTLKSDEPLLGLKSKFKCEREALEKTVIESQVKQLNAQQEKTLSRNLIGFLEQKVKRILRALDFIIVFLVISDVALAVYSNLRFSSNLYDLHERIIKEKHELDSEVINLRYVMLALIGLIEVLLLIKYYFRLKLLRLRSLASNKDTVPSTKLFKRLLAEMLILSPFTPPENKQIISGKMFYGEYSYSLDSIILLFNLLKLYYFLLFLARISPWMSSRTREIARQLKAAVKYNFTLKAGLNRHPIGLMLLSFVFFTVFLGVVIKICEFSFSQIAEENWSYKTVTQKEDKKNPFFESYFDVFWLVVITMATVGYGDIYPQTHMGRFFCFIASLFGMIFVSLMIVKVGDLVELGTQEKEAFHAIQMNNGLNQIEIKAKDLIRGLFKLKQIKLREKRSFSNGTKLSNFLSELLVTKRRIKDFYFIMKKKASNSLFLEDIVNHFSHKVEDNVDDIGFFKYVGDDMVDLISKINDSHMQIYQSLDLLKAKQNNVSKFILDVNKHMVLKKKENEKFIEKQEKFFEKKLEVEK